MAGWMSGSKTKVFIPFLRFGSNKKVSAPGSGNLVFLILGYKTHQKPMKFSSPGWPGLDFHYFLIRFVLETYHVGALPGQA